MGQVKKKCQVRGCISLAKSIGKRAYETKQYDGEGFLLRSTWHKKETYYSTFCSFHQKAYNRPNTQ